MYGAGAFKEGNGNGNIVDGAFDNDVVTEVEPTETFVNKTTKAYS